MFANRGKQILERQIRQEYGEMKNAQVHQKTTKKVPKIRVVKFGSVASPIRDQIIKAVEKVAAKREALHAK